MASSSKFQLPALDIPSQSLTAGTNIPPPPPSPPRTKSPSQIFNTSTNSPSDQRRPSQPLKTAYSNQRLRDLSPGAAPSPTDSPNPLRSHPTSSHSLARKFSGSPLVGGGVAGEENPNSNGESYNKASSQQHQPSGAVKRVPTNSSSLAHSASSSTASPPHKRPLSVRKLLSLRALNSAFGGSSRHGDNNSGRSATPGPGSSSSLYGNSSGKKSSDNLSMFSFARPGSSMGGGGSEFGGSEGGGKQQPTLRKRRSSAFWGRRGITFLGLAVEEERGEGDRMDVDGAGARKENVGQGTPPPMLPEVSSFEKGVKEEDGGFLGGGEMFKDIR